MEPLDGNAIAGTLFAHFGEEMTAISGSCAHCGASTLIAELVVYARAPGAVARCPHCAGVVMVVGSSAEHALVDCRSFTIAVS